MNDPQPFYWNGEYHIFFLHHGHPVRRRAARGHIVSRDLVHWQRLPTAFSPTAGGPDRNGCWTGSFYEDAGAFYTLYTGCISREPLHQTQCLATSDDLISWSKYEDNPVEIQKPAGFGSCWRDPLIWKEGADWCAILGSELPANQGGAALLYSSPDLTRWQYEHPLLVDREGETGARFECPDFFPMDGKHVLLTSDDVTWRTYWRVGTYTERRFEGQKWGIVDGGDIYAAKTLGDDRGRRILFGWIMPARSDEELVEAGWSGALSLPRQLILHPDDTLRIRPVPELAVLRGQQRHFDGISLAEGKPLLLEGVEGDALELLIGFAPTGAETLTVSVRCSPDLREGTEIVYDRAAGLLGGAPLHLQADEGLILRIFVDRSIVEAYANDRACHTVQTYPARDDCLHVALGARGAPARVESVDVWSLSSPFSTTV